MTAYSRTQIRRPPGEQGMTLIELLIVLLILSTTSGAMFSLLLTSFKVYWKGDIATQAQQGARISVDRMVRDLRQARRFISGVTKTAGTTSVTFNTNCLTPQISVALPHLASVALANGTTIFMTDPSASGTIPYDGSYVTYYLAASPNSPTPNAAGPYLIRASYDLVAQTLTVGNVAANITALSFSDAGGCTPGTSTREMLITLTAFQQAVGQAVASQTTVADAVTLRNQ